MMTLQNRQSTVSSIGRVVTAVCVCLLSAPSTALADAAAVALEKAGVSKGIGVVIGLPETVGPAFVAGLANESDLLIYVQAVGGDEATAVRQAAETANLLGRDFR